VTITIHPLPAVGTTVSPAAAVCFGSSVTLNGTGALTYSWSDGITNGVSFVPSAAKTYSVTGTDVNGCSDTDTVTVAVIPYPIILMQPADQATYVDSSVQFITSITGGTLQWQQDAGSGFINLSNGGPYSGVTTDTLSINPVTLAQNNYTFRCIASSGNCTDTTSTASLTVNTVTPIHEDENENTFSLFPNPASDKLFITFTAGKSTYRIRLMELNGAVLIDKQGATQPGSNTIELPLGSLAKGIYILSARTDNGVKNTKIVIE